MGTRSNLYIGQPGDTATTLVTSPASTVTTITYAEAYNTSTEAVTISLFVNSVRFAEKITLAPLENVTLFPFLGAVLNASDTLMATASDATTINVKIDGYQVTTA